MTVTLRMGTNDGVLWGSLGGLLYSICKNHYWLSVIHFVNITLDQEDENLGGIVFQQIPNEQTLL